MGRKMKKYLFLIKDEDESNWDLFKILYKKEGMGKNLDDALHHLIRRFIKEKKG